QLNHRPFPAAGLPIDDGKRTHALHGKQIEDEKRKSDSRRKPRAAGFGVDLLSHPALNGGVTFIVTASDAVDGCHRAYEHLAGGKGSDQRNTDLPIVAQWPDGRLQCFSDYARIRIFK